MTPDTFANRYPCSCSIVLQQLVDHLRSLTRRMHELEIAKDDLTELIANLQQRLAVLEAAIADSSAPTAEASLVNHDEAVALAQIILTTHDIRMARVTAWAYLIAIGQPDTATWLSDHDCVHPPVA